MYRPIHQADYKKKLTSTIDLRSKHAKKFLSIKNYGKLKQSILLTK